MYLLIYNTGMPRTREKTSNRGNDPDLMRRAADMCINEGKSERSVGENLGICHVSLNRYIKKVRATEFGGSPPKCVIKMKILKGNYSILTKKVKR